MGLSQYHTELGVRLSDSRLTWVFLSLWLTMANAILTFFLVNNASGGSENSLWLVELHACILRPKVEPSSFYANSRYAMVDQLRIRLQICEAPYADMTALITEDFIQTPTPLLSRKNVIAMSESSICLKSISSLLKDDEGNPTRFWIPAYQRGFRWTPHQVTQLLDDIWDFVQSSDAGHRAAFYCLQPLVIKRLRDGRCEVVDGQQRLTTIHIILSYLNEIITILGKKRFSISFETRADSSEPFLRDINLERAHENIDFWHICKAFEAVKKWFSVRDGSHKLKFVQGLLNDDEVGRNVKVVWFELAEGDNAVDAFTRLNVGKIPLTSDELIRALFLRRPSDIDSDATDLQMRIAHEWDMVEKALQVDSFWYFLNNDQGKSQNRIGFLFDLVAKSDGVDLSGEGDAYRVFYHFNERLRANALEQGGPEAEWKRIKQRFQMLEEWFEDRTLFHIFGFLVHTGEDINTLTKLSQDCPKDVFENRLRREAFQASIGSLVDPFTEDNIEEAVVEKLDSLIYPRRSAHIRSLLLLFNVATLLENKRSNIRFQFDSFKQGDWDIEHVRSVSPDDLNTVAARREWLESVKSFFASQGDQEEYQNMIDEFLAKPNPKSRIDEFNSLYETLVRHFKEKTEPEPDHSIANLVLLDAGTNRSYKNAVFAIKRKRLLDLDHAGIFVPLCTRNVFLKCYSRHVDNAMFWQESDRDAYVDAIAKTLIGFFLGKVKSEP